MSRVMTAVRAVLAPVRGADCPPDCRFEFMCDAQGRRLRRECCFRPDCVYQCSGWTVVGTC